MRLINNSIVRLHSMKYIHIIHSILSYGNRPWAFEVTGHIFYIMSVLMFC